MADVKLSHPEKVLFPADGITKADLADYYEAVAPAMVRHTRDRPMNLWRWNAGIERPVVVQQAIPKGAPEWVATVEVARRRGGNVIHAIANDAATLRWLAQVNCITPHVWTSRVDRLDRPDRVIFDLDPPDEGVEFDLIREGALALGEHLRSIGLEPHAMTSGSRGIHVLAPLRRTKGHDEVRQWAAEIGVAVAEEQETLTTEWRKNKREGRILIDTARNTYAQTTVAPYAVRAKPGAPVATPLRWEELEDPRLRANSHTLASIPARLESLGDPWEGLGRG
jgi:bifunctional non-homologous end joining protein LigD